jgi:hypothetical protein
MGTINLITGTASGKIGQFQYQTHGMKCVVRTKQPEGLTNDQAELINKPILINLSQAYHHWAKHLLSNYLSDWKKPQALWNYYTKCNQGLFDGTAGYESGYAVVKHGATVQYQATYTVRPFDKTAVFQFDQAPAVLDKSAVICLVYGLVSGPPEDWIIFKLPVTETPQAVPYWSVEAGSEDIGYFLVDQAGKLYAGMTLCTVKGEVPPEYFSPTPAEVAANMLIYEEYWDLYNSLRLRFNFNADFMPSWITGKTIRYTAHVALEGHPAGTSWTAVYSPSVTFLLEDYDVVSTVDPLLTWVIVEGDTEKSDPITLTVSQLIPPPGFFDQCQFVVYQEESADDEYYAVLQFWYDTEEQYDFAVRFYVNFTGQGSIVSHLPKNPMFYMFDDFPYLWDESPHIPVTPPCGTAQFVIGDHRNDSRYNFGDPFTVGYEEP